MSHCCLQVTKSFMPYFVKNKILRFLNLFFNCHRLLFSAFNSFTGVCAVFIRSVPSILVGLLMLVIVVVLLVTVILLLVSVILLITVILLVTVVTITVGSWRWWDLVVVWVDPAGDLISIWVDKALHLCSMRVDPWFDLRNLIQNKLTEWKR